MGKFIIFFVFPLFFMSAQTYPANNSNWILEENKSDDFNGSFNSQKWKKNEGLWFKCSGEVYFKPENTRIMNGELQILVKEESVTLDSACNWRTFYNYTSGALVSNFEVGDDFFVEVRAKLNNYRANINSAIWFADTPEESNNPNPEFDLVETMTALTHPNKIHAGMHVWNRNPNYHSAISGDKLLDPSDVISNDYHVFGFERNSGWIRYYYDEVLFWEIETSQIPSYYPQYDNPFLSEFIPGVNVRERRIIISAHGNGSVDTPEIIEEFLPSILSVDYIKVYKQKCVNNIDIITPIITSNEFQASNQITASSNIYPNATVSLNADRIILENGFSASGYSNSVFRGFVYPCSSGRYEAVKKEFSLVKNEDSLDRIILHPIPFSSFLAIENTGDIKEWSLSDIYGKVVKHNIENIPEDKITIDTNDLSPGVYYFKAVLKNGELFQETVIKK